MKIAHLPAWLAFSAVMLVRSLSAEQAPLPVEAFRQMSPRIYCSGEPVAPDVFDRIAAFGIKTIVSVDGKPPAVEAAEKAGLRYVHLPIGYDGVPLPVQAALKKLLETTQGTILIHCHHGKHRGPAAAAIAAMIDKGISKEQAMTLMKQAGTGPDYRGLWRDVQNFAPSAASTSPAALVSVAKVSPFVREMTRIDSAFEKLEDIKQEAWDARLADEQAVVLVEGFREALRNTGKDHSADMISHLKKSLESVVQFNAALKNSKTTELITRLETIKQDCRECHHSYRD